MQNFKNKRVVVTGQSSGRVNIVSPGPVDTPIWTKVDMTDPQIGEMNLAIQNSVPLNRFGAPAEVANSLAFLASEEATFTTGTDLKVSGGLHLFFILTFKRMKVKPIHESLVRDIM